MSIKKLFEEHSPEELVECFVFPVRLTAKQRLEADEQLTKHREQHRAELAESKIIETRLKTSEIMDSWDK